MHGNREELRRRRTWVQLYAETKNAGLVCRRCGISRPTLRLWWNRFRAKGDEGLFSRNRRPHHSPRRVLDQNRLDLILRLRDKRKPGPKRIQAELLRHHAIRLSMATIWKVLHRCNSEWHNLSVLKESRNARYCFVLCRAEWRNLYRTSASLKEVFKILLSLLHFISSRDKILVCDPVKSTLYIGHGSRAEIVSHLVLIENVVGGFGPRVPQNGLNLNLAAEVSKLCIFGKPKSIGT